MAEIVADKPLLPRQRTLVVIHGNIGAGKSTTLRSLSSKYERYVATGEVVIIPEPVEDWIDAGLLQALYDNALSSGVFQLAALATRVGAWSKILQDDKARLIFAERSPASDRAIFAETLLTGHELVAYNLAYNAIAPVEPRRTVHIVLECSQSLGYFRTPPRPSPRPLRASRLSYRMFPCSVVIVIVASVHRPIRSQLEWSLRATHLLA